MPLPALRTICSAFAALIVTTTGVCQSAHAQIDIALDVDGNGAPASQTQDGFTRLASPGALATDDDDIDPLTATVDGVTVTVDIITGQDLRFRYRYTPLSIPNPFPNLLRDFVEVGDGDGSSLGVTIADLPAGTYELTTFHFDRSVGGPNPFDIFVDDALGLDRLVVDDGTFFNQALINEGFSYIVASNGVDPILVSIVEDSDIGRIRFNGLTITTAVPEPASAGLALLGIAAVLRRRRR